MTTERQPNPPQITEALIGRFLDERHHARDDCPLCAQVAAAARAEVAALDVERLARALAEEGRYIGWTDADWRKQASKVAAAYENDR